MEDLVSTFGLYECMTMDPMGHLVQGECLGEKLPIKFEMTCIETTKPVSSKVRAGRDMLILRRGT